MRRYISLLLLFFMANQLHAQDTLPNFNLTERGNRVIISWYNPYESIIQLNVQRSFDSLKNFRTIYSAPSPELPQNGFSEKKLPTNQIYYRIFYVLKGGSYFFSESKKIGGDFSNRDINAAAGTISGDESGRVTIKVRDLVHSTIPATRYRAFRDSVLQKTKDTLNAINDSLVVILPFRGPDNFRASSFIYTSRLGVNISLPAAKTRKYKLKFFEENGAPLFEIPHIKESQLILDKSNFLHAGWFLFELYEDEKLKEKNRFYLSRDF